MNEHVNSPYQQGYYDCVEGKRYYPHYILEIPNFGRQLVEGSELSNYDRGQYTKGWDAAIMGDAL